MKERLITAAGALLALIVLYAVLFHSTSVPVTRPVTPEGGRNGYLAISQWLESSGIQVLSLRERYDVLIDPDPQRALRLSRRGNLLITTMPHLLPVRSKEHESLKAWLRSGNTLLILAALDDTPEWFSQNGHARFMQDLQIMAGMRFEPLDGDSDDAPQNVAVVPADSQLELEPVEGHPLMAGVTTLLGFSDDESALWEPAAPFARPGVLLRLAAERSSGADAAWQRPYGNGHIIIVASGTLLTNHVVARADAYRFLTNLLAYHVEEDGAVVFDDMHQGLSAIYDAAAFFADPRFRRTLWFLIGAWFIYVLGSSNRFAPPVAGRTVPRQQDFVEAVGGFMARRLDSRDAAKLLLEDWFDDIKHTRGLRGAAPPWKALEATPTLDTETYSQLRGAYEALQRGSTVDLVKLHHLLRKAKEAIG